MSWLQKQIVYLQDNPQGFWFKRKLYGWGWTPARPAGWVTLLVFLTLLLRTLWRDGQFVEEPTVEQLQLLIGLSILFFIIVWRTGEPPRWQCGKHKDDEV